MSGTTNQGAYGRPDWGPQRSGTGSPWGTNRWNSAERDAGNEPWFGPRWDGPPPWHPAWLTKPVAIVLMIVGFIFWWPVGLAMLFYMIWSGRMGCWGRRYYAEHRDAGWRGQEPPWTGWWRNRGSHDRNTAEPASSGNRAFDEYRAETLRRLEEEQNDFASFLDRLRFAKDKAEFDQFMAERRGQPRPPTEPEANRPPA